MKAVTFHGKRDIRVDNVPDPAIEQPTDASHKLPLDQAPQAYEIFQKKQDGAIKILLTP